MSCPSTAASLAQGGPGDLLQLMPPGRHVGMSISYDRCFHWVANFHWQQSAKKCLRGSTYWHSLLDTAAPLLWGECSSISGTRKLIACLISSSPGCNWGSYLLSPKDYSWGLIIFWSCISTTIRKKVLFHSSSFDIRSFLTLVGRSHRWLNSQDLYLHCKEQTTWMSIVIFLKVHLFWSCGAWNQGINFGKRKKKVCLTCQYRRFNALWRRTIVS